MNKFCKARHKTTMQTCSTVIFCFTMMISPQSFSASGEAKKEVYSPYAKQNDIPQQPLWGDSHLHTTLSMDAGLFGNRLPPSEAYRFARGEEVISSTGQPVRLSRPLDWKKQALM